MTLDTKTFNSVEQYDTFKYLCLLFDDQLFFPIYKIFNHEDIIILAWEIGYHSYRIEILEGGTISIIISVSTKKLIIKELEILFNMVNQAFVEFGSNHVKLERYVKQTSN